MAITRRASTILTTACLAVMAIITVTAANFSGTAQLIDQTWIWAGATFVTVAGLYAIEPVRDRASRVGRSLVDGFMATARHQLHIRHKLIAQAHDAVARRAESHRQDDPTVSARWRMCPST